MRRRLASQIHRDVQALLPSDELPWMPPWGPELEDELVDLVTEILVLQANVAGSRWWELDAAGDGYRRASMATIRSLQERCRARGFSDTVGRLRDIAEAVGRWEALSVDS